MKAIIEMDIKKILGENLKRYRSRAQLSQEQLAEKIDISVTHLSNLEQGKTFISAELLETIYEILKVTPSALFYSSSLDSVDNNALKDIEKILDKKLKEVKEEIRETI